jgi:hypothetical protein
MATLRALRPRVPAMQAAIARHATRLQWSYAELGQRDHAEVGPDALDVALWAMTAGTDLGIAPPSYRESVPTTPGVTGSGTSAGAPVHLRLIRPPQSLVTNQAPANLTAAEQETAAAGAGPEAAGGDVVTGGDRAESSGQDEQPVEQADLDDVAALTAADSSTDSTIGQGEELRVQEEERGDSSSDSDNVALGDAATARGNATAGGRGATSALLAEGGMAAVATYTPDPSRARARRRSARPPARRGPDVEVLQVGTALGLVDPSALEPPAPPEAGAPVNMPEKVAALLATAKPLGEQGAARGSAAERAASGALDLDGQIANRMQRERRSQGSNTAAVLLRTPPAASAVQPSGSAAVTTGSRHADLLRLSAGHRVGIDAEAGAVLVGRSSVPSGSQAGAVGVHGDGAGLRSGGVLASGASSRAAQERGPGGAGNDAGRHTSSDAR